MARCCSKSDRKISKCGNTFPVHCQILKGAKVQLFQGRKQNLYSFLFTLPKVAPLHPVGFSLSIFRRKITEIDRAVILSEVVRLEPYPPQFLKFGHVPLPDNDWEKQENDSLQHLHFDLCFGGEGGMPGLSHALVPAQESKRWSFGRFDTQIRAFPVTRWSLLLAWTFEPFFTKKLRVRLNLISAICLILSQCCSSARHLVMSISSCTPSVPQQTWIVATSSAAGAARRCENLTCKASTLEATLRYLEEAWRLWRSLKGASKNSSKRRPLKVPSSKPP